MSGRTRVVILGAAGRDFHNFNIVYRDDPAVEVVAFTAAQIAGLSGRRYPPALAGSLYPDGIAIHEEAELERLCEGYGVDLVVFAYSDVPHAHVMHLASRALAAGADFALLGPRRTMLRAAVPVIAVSAVRTGCGKSPAARFVARLLREHGLRVALIRHPMPYGDLERQAVQRFASRADLDAAGSTIEEREEYEPHLAMGNVVYAGIDYARIAALAAADAEVLVWDGGNNDFPFLRPNLHIVLADPLRPGHEVTYHPGETVLRMADVAVVAKTDAASPGEVARVMATVRAINPRAAIVAAASPIRLDEEALVRGKRVLVVEDGPTITHGGMPHGAGYIAARRAGAASIVDPRPFCAADITAVFEAYPHIGPVLPAIGYNAAQMDALRRTVDATAADVVVAATPVDLGALLRPNKPVVRARYDYADAGEPTLRSHIEAFLRRARLIRDA